MEDLDVRIASRIEEAIQKALAPVLNQLVELNKSINARLDGLEKKVKKNAEVAENVKEQTMEIWEHIEHLIQKNDNLENQDRRMNVLIHGMQEDPNGETWEQSKQKAIEVFEKGNVMLEPRSIQRAHRVFGNTRPRPIIVRFVHYEDREKALNIGKKVEGIRISEDISMLVRNKRHTLAPYQKEAYNNGLKTYYSKDKLIVEKTSFVVDSFLETTTAYLEDGSRREIKSLKDFWTCLGKNKKRGRQELSPYTQTWSNQRAKERRTDLQGS